VQRQNLQPTKATNLSCDAYVVGEKVIEAKCPRRWVGDISPADKTPGHFSLTKEQSHFLQPGNALSNSSQEI